MGLNIHQRIKTLTSHLVCGTLIAVLVAISAYKVKSHASNPIIREPVQACVIPRDVKLTAPIRSEIAKCLGWQALITPPSAPFCPGGYQEPLIKPLTDPEEMDVSANHASLYRQGRSILHGDVAVQKGSQILNAQTAYVYHDAKTNQVTRIELLGEVRYVEPGRLMIAKKGVFNPQDKSGKVDEVLYRFNFQRRAAVLPAWGRARFIERFANKNYFLKDATYSQCAPQDKAWHIEANSITIDDATSTGVARNASLQIYDVPVLYTPYLSFPTSKERKSGFLMPTIGSSNVGGFDFTQPYYWNLAPNYDATIIPHYYSRRGLMMGGQFRYLTPLSKGVLTAHILPKDQAFNHFINNNQVQYPVLNGLSTNRWSLQAIDSTWITPNLHLGINAQQVSDSYYLQDFSNNFAIITERQLLQEANLSYVINHWAFHGMVQRYQTLHPINETPIENIYQRLPQLLALGQYDEVLPFHGGVSILAQYDQFKWPNEPFLESLRVVNTQRVEKPEGPRFHLTPLLSFPQRKPWGFFTPSVDVVENNYYVSRNHFASFNDSNPLNNYGYAVPGNTTNHYNRVIPRYSIDSGLFFEKPTSFFGQPLIQTLEPRIYYLNVPFHDQTPIPVYDSGYMIFNVDQLFRNNRFSGFDRIGDANQLAYAITSRWLSGETGAERASLAIGQIRYFQNRRVQLCQSALGVCIDDPLTLGYLSPTEDFSPIATRAMYHFNQAWLLTGDLVWDAHAQSSKNAYLNLHYQPENNTIVNIGYSYLTNGDITQVANNNPSIDPLQQVTFSYAWPFTDQWSTLGGYNYNIAKGYEMLAFFGIQYDSCCWAVRLLGGQTFQSLNSNDRPVYNNTLFLQILLKGLGSVGNSDPSSIIRTNLPTYIDNFHNRN